MINFTDSVGIAPKTRSPKKCNHTVYELKAFIKKKKIDSMIKLAV